jgi:hypothetical protein
MRSVDLEQLAALGLLRGIRPGRHHRVQHRGRHAVRHHGDQLHEAARLVAEPRHARDDRVGDRRRQLLGVA